MLLLLYLCTARAVTFTFPGTTSEWETFIRTDDSGAITAYGVSFPDFDLEGLPSEYNEIVALFDETENSAFSSMTLNYYPEGHPGATQIPQE